MGFNYFFYGGEKNEALYIQKFKELYSEDIITPENIIVYFDLRIDQNITHVWRGGKKGPFSQARASRIGWIKEILENHATRIIKRDYQNEHIFFVSHKISKCTYYMVICKYRKAKQKYRFETGFILHWKQREKYLKLPDFV